MEEKQREVEDYIKCELIGGGSPRQLITCVLLLHATRISTHAMSTTK